MTYLFWYKLLFITQLIVAECLIVNKFPKRKLWGLRFVASLIVCYGVAILYPLAEGSYNWWATSVMFLILFLVTVGCLTFCLKTSFINIFFCAIASYTIQHLAYQIFDFFNRAVFHSATNFYSDNILTLDDFYGVMGIQLIVYLDVFVITYIVASTFLNRKMQNAENLKFKNSAVIVFVVFVLLVDIVLNAFVQYDDTYGPLVNLYNILCCISVFYIQIGMMETGNAKQELEVVNLLYRQMQKHYNLQKQNNDLLNIKYHDLKHQIREYANKSGISSESIEEIQNILSVYNSRMDTGNESLDVILSEKSLLCHDKGITLTCAVKGEGLSFMKDSDLYALFGNILDNAIEATENIAEPNRRCINLHCHQKGSMIIVKTDNYFDGTLEMDKEGLPITTKGSTDYHGFGVKSIRYIVEKYSGDLSIEVVDDIFRLNILIPCP